jgi:prevent-host-death family protein
MKIQPTHSVGSRELKTRLGTYLRQVRDGATLIVTDRGRPVAELRPLERYQGGAEARLRELAALGVVSGGVGERVPLAPFEPIRGASLSQAIIEDREDRF